MMTVLTALSGWQVQVIVSLLVKMTLLLALAPPVPIVTVWGIGAAIQITQCAPLLMDRDGDIVGHGCR